MAAPDTNPPKLQTRDVIKQLQFGTVYFHSTHTIYFRLKAFAIFIHLLHLAIFHAILFRFDSGGVQLAICSLKINAA